MMDKVNVKEADGELDGNPFWEYSLRLYGEPGIEEICLNYQDTHKANINLLLFCCWAGAQRRQFSPDEIALAGQLICRWDEQVVQQLRQLRQLLNKVDTVEHTIANASEEPDAPAFRKQIKELELMAERIVQDSLNQWWLELPDYVGVEERLGIVANINGYLEQLGAESVDGDNKLVTAALALPA